MSKIQFDLDIDGLRELMSSSEMQEILNTIGADVANKAMGMTGEDFGHETRTADYVAIGTVFPQTESAARVSYQDNILEKALAGLPRTKGGQ